MAKEQDYKLIRADIGAKRLGADKLDVRNAVLELSLFETLDKPYATGELVLLDDKSLVDSIDFRGTETLDVEIASETGLRPIAARRMMMRGIVKTRKADSASRSSVLVISLIDEHGFAGRAMKVSRSARGRPDEIARSLIEATGVDVDGVPLASPPSPEMSLVLPWSRPLDAASWVLARATDELGMPLAAWSPVMADRARVRVDSLSAMLSRPPFNRGNPYVYSPSNLETAEAATDVGGSFIVQSFAADNVMNSLALVESGSWGATASATDLSTGKETSEAHGAKRVADRLEGAGIIDPAKQMFSDPAHSGDFPTARRYHFLDSGKRGEYGHDELPHRRLLPRTAWNFLRNYTMTLVVPGTAFATLGAGAGDVMNLLVSSDDSERARTISPDTAFDSHRSGPCLVADVRHTFSGTSHVAVLNVVKLQKI